MLFLNIESITRKGRILFLFFSRIIIFEDFFKVMKISFLYLLENGYFFQL